MAVTVWLSPCKKNLCYLLDWKLFKNNEKCFLFHLKSSFCSQDISVFLTTFGLCRKSRLISKITLTSKGRVFWFQSLFREFTQCYKIRNRLLGQVYHFSLLICYPYSFMASQPGLQTIAIHILPNISRSRRNQTMKFGQLIEYNKKVQASGLQLSSDVFR